MPRARARRAFAAALLLAVSTGCASRLRSLSAGSLGCPTREIRISNIQDKWNGMEWTASCRGQRVLCRYHNVATGGSGRYYSSLAEPNCLSEHDYDRIVGAARRQESDAREEARLAWVAVDAGRFDEAIVHVHNAAKRGYTDHGMQQVVTESYCGLGLDERAAQEFTAVNKKLKDATRERCAELGVELP